MMASAEARRDKTLRTIAEYRASFANLLNKAGQKIIEGEAVEVENPAALAGSTDA
jgi:hypothetical protein